MFSEQSDPRPWTNKQEEEDEGGILHKKPKTSQSDMSTSVVIQRRNSIDGNLCNSQKITICKRQLIAPQMVIDQFHRIPD